MRDVTTGTIAKQKRRRRRIRKLAFWLLVLLLVFGVMRLIVLPRLNAAATTTYDSYRVTRGTLSTSMSFDGSIDVVNDETLSASAAGAVRKIYVAEGDAVSQGQRLVRLSNGEVLKAGFDGEIYEIYMEEGDDVSANTSVIRIVDFQNLQVSIRVDEYSISNVRVGQTCGVSVDALNQIFDSEITHINRIPTGGTTAYYTVTAGFSGSAEVLPGMQVTVEIPDEEVTDAVLLSLDALSFGPSNNAYVMVQNAAGEMVRTDVTIGVDNDSTVQIISGVTAGQTVYKLVETAQDEGGLFSLFSSRIQERQSTTTTTTQTFDPSTMRQNRTFDGNFTRP